MTWIQPPWIQMVRGQSCTCWAAALEGWLKVTWVPDPIFVTPKSKGVGRQTVTRDELISMFGMHDPTNRFVCDGQLDLRMQKAFDKVLAPMVGMKMEVLKEKFLLSNYAIDKLKNGPLYLIFERDGARFAHVVVVWGSFRHPDDDELVLKVMDPHPDKDKGGGLGWRRISFFDNCKMQVGWPASGGFLTWAPG